MRCGPKGFSLSLSLLLLQPFPRMPCIERTISCFFLRPRPSSPWYSTGTHICLNAASLSQIRCCGWSFINRSQKVASNGRITAMSFTPTSCSRLSVSTTCFTQFVKVTWGKFCFVLRLVLDILISRLCPNFLKTKWAPDSDRFKSTAASFLSPEEATLVTLACRMASLHATSAVMD